MTTLTHDPDEGCEFCPLLQGSPKRANGMCLGVPWKEGLMQLPERLAPGWCPLRKGPVTVHRAKYEHVERWMRERGAEDIGDLRIDSASFLTNGRRKCGFCGQPCVEGELYLLDDGDYPYCLNQIKCRDRVEGERKKAVEEAVILPPEVVACYEESKKPYRGPTRFGGTVVTAEGG